MYRIAAPALPGLSPPDAPAFAVTESLDEFLGAPVGRCLVREQFLTFCHSPELQGMILWGAIEAPTVEEMTAAARFVHHPSIAERRRVLVDLREAGPIEPDLLLGHPGSELGRRTGLERQAVLVPPGLGGLLAAGALALAGPAHPMLVTVDPNAALRFLEHPAAGQAHRAAWAICTSARGRSILLHRVRARIERDPGQVQLQRLASELGMSTRTLQRELTRLGTSLRDEVRRARVDAAEALLRYGDRKIESIAAELGFGTASRLTAALRRERGLSASDLRALWRR